jgi:hypothetical protein
MKTIKDKNPWPQFRKAVETCDAHDMAKMLATSTKGTVVEYIKIVTPSGGIIEIEKAKKKRVAKKV